MDKNEGRRNLFIVIIGVALLLLVVIIFLVWLFGRATKPVETSSTSTTAETEITETKSEDVKNLVAFTLPEGWTEQTCASTPGAIYPVAPDRELDCSNDPDNVMVIAVDSENTTDCNQLQDVKDVSKHVCKSIFIDGHRTLEASTAYNLESNLYPNRTIDAYYLDTGNGVVSSRYIHPEPGSMLSEFQQIVQSMKVE